MNTINIALIGPGEVADRFLAPALSKVEGARLYGVMGRDVEKTAAFSQKHGAVRAPYTSIEEIARDSAVHAAIIASPDGGHAQQAVPLLDAGKHLFIEKPLATASADAASIVAAAARNSVVAAVGYHLRWHAGHRLLKERIAQGEVGTVRRVSVNWTYPIPPSNWRNGSTDGKWWSLGALGTHGIDLGLWLTDGFDEIDEVNCVTSNAVYGGRDESAHVTMKLRSGAMIDVFSSALYNSERRVSVYGDKKTATCVGTLGPRGAGEIRIGDGALAFEPVDPYHAELTDFVSAIREGRGAEVNAKVGYDNVCLLEQLS